MFSHTKVVRESGASKMGDPENKELPELLELVGLVGLGKSGGSVFNYRRKDPAETFSSNSVLDWKQNRQDRTIPEEDNDNPKIPQEDIDDLLLQIAIFNSMQLSSGGQQSNPVTPSSVSSVLDDNRDVDIDDLQLALSISMQGSQHKILDDASRKTPDGKHKGILTSSCEVKPLDLDEFPSRPSAQYRAESSWNPCGICKDCKPTGELLQMFQCGHFFCEECMRDSVGKKIQENIHLEITCPAEKCKETLSFEQCGLYLPEEVKDQWLATILESEALANPLSIKCPSEECGDEFFDDKKGFFIRACPKCSRAFCVNCEVPWHFGQSCDEFQQGRRGRQCFIIIRRVGEICILKI